MKQIEEAEAGDVVLSTDAAQPASDGQTPLRQQVTRTFERTVGEVIDLHVGKEVITATAEHPFWVIGAGWTAAGELRRGSALLAKGGVIVHVDSVERRKGTFKVYNFEVGNAHTYYISALGLLVHNQCGDYVDLTDSTARTHILDGDATGGGHRPGTGISGKSEFPAGLSDDEIIHHISDVATDPASTRVPQPNGRIRVDGTRGGVDIRVILDPSRGGRIVTGFPTNLPRNP